MNTNILLIELQKGLGFFKLESNINYILSEIRSRGEQFEHADIVLGDTFCEPIYIVLNREGIKLRFDHFYQKLELIEIEAGINKNRERTHSIYYKNNLLIPGNTQHLINNSTNPNLTYNYINSVFGPTNMPKLVDNNQFLLLRYSGASFLFENLGVDSEESVILASEAVLSKIVLFSEKFLIDSIQKENNLHKIPQYLIKVEIDKGISILNGTSCFNLNNNNTENQVLDVNCSATDISINFGESLENVLYKLQNPNYVYYKVNESYETSDYGYYDSDNSFFSHNGNTFDSIINLNSEDCDFFLNYYSLGIDILIDASTHKVKKFILHTNNPLDVKFGIYNRSNFSIELTKTFFRKLERINDTSNMNDRESLNINMNNINNSTPKSRKTSDDSTEKKINFNPEEGIYSYSAIAINNSYSPDNNTTINRIERTENLNYINNYYNKEYTNLGYKDNYNLVKNVNNSKDNETHNTNCINSTNKKRRDHKTSFDREPVGEKSFGSINESNLSISLNTSDIYMSLFINPNTNFLDILNRMPLNSFVLYHRHEPKLNLVSKYYAFDGIIFEVMENFSIASVTLVKSNIK